MSGDPIPYDIVRLNFEIAGLVDSAGDPADLQAALAGLLREKGLWHLAWMFAKSPEYAFHVTLKEHRRDRGGQRRKIPHIDLDDRSERIVERLMAQYGIERRTAFRWIGVQKKRNAPKPQPPRPPRNSDIE
jgi:hypothetical protein